MKSNSFIIIESLIYFQLIYSQNNFSHRVIMYFVCLENRVNPLSYFFGISVILGFEARRRRPDIGE